MYTAKNYIKVSSASEACELLQNSKKNKIVAGNMWLRLGNGSYNTLIDITDCGLDYITDDNDFVKIGACTVLREIEESKLLANNFNNMFQEVTKYIVGIQFRNTATIGGNVFLKHGFSDIITLLLALNADLVFHNYGKIKLEHYLKQQIKGDLLKEIIIEKKQNVWFKAFKSTATDLSMINVAIVKKNGKIRVAVGAKPSVADIKEFSANCKTETIANSFKFGNNMRCSAEYRLIVLKNMLEQYLNNK